MDVVFFMAVSLFECIEKLRNALKPFMFPASGLFLICLERAGDEYT